MQEAEPGQPVEISLVPLDQADNAEFVTRIADLVNKAYADAEKGLWRDGTRRTSADEVAAVIRAGQLAVARLDGRLVGTVRVQRLHSGEAEFGMLVASPQHRGLGIGRALVTFAEAWARDRGLDRMQLELLVPRAWTDPVKDFLRHWYTRIGYREVRVGQLDEAYPAHVPYLATPCDFVIFHKTL
ncbi:acetyltransferase (GNAT) family protein [Micromonospora pisi]|uniref:Acetyltransferase (GNAT) family protein n=1 Tax=Micromonospora pisi TaxID=589240 RepID=A0A495JS27_9ACTN|nr:GNAT family N-acetyltransferase [Micromonospora pisi]RKR91318.1 acetyltransferase (GNAT) family protein [Micromonospora pisi]